MASNKNQKKVAAKRLVDSLKSSTITFPDMEEFANALVDPGSGPVVFPQRAPGRSGSAVFPLVKEIKATSLAHSEVGIIISPDMDKPLRISRFTPVAESTTAVLGIGVRTDKSYSMEGTYPCSVQSSPIDFFQACQLSSAAGATLNFNFEIWAEEPSLVNLQLRGWNGAVWTILHNASYGPGDYSGSAAGIAWSNTYTHYNVGLFNSTSETDLSVQYSLAPSAGTISCGALYDEKVMNTFVPSWDGLIDDCKKIYIVACDILVTYEGSSLANAGSIAVANIDDDFSVPTDTSLYEMVASRPFDKYRGRLASEGETEGGCHWHYIPTSDQELNSANAENVPNGVVGITGLQLDQVVRVECHFMVNFYSEKPQYDMQIPPPITGYSPLLWSLRSEIPLVSSNDTHKIIKSVKKLSKKAGNAMTDPRVLQALSMLAAL